MDPNTGRIQQVLNEKEARRNGLVPIPRKLLAKVEAMTTTERKAWAKSKKAKNAARRSRKALPKIVKKVNVKHPVKQPRQRAVKRYGAKAVKVAGGRVASQANRDRVAAEKAAKEGRS